MKDWRRTNLSFNDLLTVVCCSPAVINFIFFACEVKESERDTVSNATMVTKGFLWAAKRAAVRKLLFTLQ